MCVYILRSPSEMVLVNEPHRNSHVDCSHITRVCVALMIELYPREPCNGVKDGVKDARVL